MDSGRDTGEEDGKEDEDGQGGGPKEKACRAERILRFPTRRQSCVLTDGFVPLLQTDRLAIENIGMPSPPPCRVSLAQCLVSMGNNS